MREWSKVATEPERLELLLHELGHFLGSTHSPEPDSVMRTILADKKARAVAFQIRFDPLNTLAMNLVADELRVHPSARIGNLSVPTQLELTRLYKEMAWCCPRIRRPSSIWA